MKETDTRKKARLIALIVLHLSAVIVTVFAVQSFFAAGGEGNMSVTGAVAFRYFTVDSNVLAAVSSFIMMICAAKQLGGSHEPPGWARLLSLAATVAVTLTMLTVVLYLGPFVYGYPALFKGLNLPLHLTTPLTELAAFVWLESVGAARIKRRCMIIGVAPMLVYGAVYLVMVVVLKRWPDFYAFNTDGTFGLTVLIMTAFTAAISYAVGLAANLVAKKSAGR